MTEVSATEFARNFGQYREMVQREAIAVTAHNRVTGYFISANEYEEFQHIKALLPKALLTGELDEAAVAALHHSHMDARHADLDKLLD